MSRRSTLRAEHCALWYWHLGVHRKCDNESTGLAQSILPRLVPACDACAKRLAAEYIQPPESGVTHHPAT